MCVRCSNLASIFMSGSKTLSILFQILESSVCWSLQSSKLYRKSTTYSRGSSESKRRALLVCISWEYYCVVSRISRGISSMPDLLDMWHCWCESVVAYVDWLINRKIMISRDFMWFHVISNDFRWFRVILKDFGDFVWFWWFRLISVISTDFDDFNWFQLEFRDWNQFVPPWNQYNYFLSLLPFLLPT